MMDRETIQEWLESLEPGTPVAIDEGGLSLIVAGNPRVYLEVGGEPEPEGEL